MEQNIVIYILTGVTTVLFALVVFFLKDYFFSRRKKEEKLSCAITELSHVLVRLDKNIASSQSACHQRHIGIDDRLKHHDVHFDTLDTRVNVVEKEVHVLKSKVK